MSDHLVILNAVDDDIIKFTDFKIPFDFCINIFPAVTVRIPIIILLNQYFDALAAKGLMIGSGLVFFKSHDLFDSFLFDPGVNVTFHLVG